MTDKLWAAVLLNNALGKLFILGRAMLPQISSEQLLVMLCICGGMGINCGHCCWFCDLCHLWNELDHFL